MIKVKKSVGFVNSFDGEKIYYEMRGQGEPIVFVYGIGCLINHWHHQIEYFSQTHTTIVFDLRGHHQTGVPKDLGTLNIATLGKDVLSLVKQLNFSQAHFIGHSFGAPVLLSAYQQNPEVFKSLALINGFAKNPIKGMFGLNAAENLFLLFKKNLKRHHLLLKTLWKAGVENPLAIYLSALAGGFNLRLTGLKDIEVYARGVSNMDLESFLLLFEDMMSFNGENILPTIKAPTLVIGGENDNVTPPKFQLEMVEKIPNCEYTQIHYGSHCTQLDFPEFVNIRIEKFLAAAKKSS